MWEVITEHELEKLADLPKYAELKKEFTPYPHQTKALRRARDQGSLLLAHGTGTGKTFTSIAFGEYLLDHGKKSVLVVAPAGLRNNFWESVRRFTNRKSEVVETRQELNEYIRRKQAGKENPPYLIVSWAMLRSAAGTLRSLSPDLLIFDEIHRARNPASKNFLGAMALRPAAPHCLGLTGSVVSNTPDDIPPLLSIVSGGIVPPSLNLKELVTKPHGSYVNMFGREKEVRAVERPKMLRTLGKYIDLVDGSDLGKEMPPAITEYIPIEMSQTQHKAYNKELSLLPPSWIKRIISGEWKNDSKSKQLLPKITRARQIAQSTYGMYGDSSKTLKTSPKVSKMAKDIREHLKEHDRNKVVVYSNFVNSGVNPLHVALRKLGIPHSIFVGPGRTIGDRRITNESRKHAVTDFKAGKTRVMVLSGAGAEGLDLKNANMFMAMEGHFNPEVIRQAQARTQRMGGQKDRSLAERKVSVRRYVSVEPSPGFFRKTWRRMKGRPERYKTTDEWIYDVARAKHFTNEGVRISLKGQIPMKPDQKPFPIKMLISKPHKYIRRWWDHKRGEWDYEYPEEL